MQHKGCVWVGGGGGGREEEELSFLGWWWVWVGGGGEERRRGEQRVRERDIDAGEGEGEGTGGSGWVGGWVVVVLTVCYTKVSLRPRVRVHLILGAMSLWTWPLGPAPVYRATKKTSSVLEHLVDEQDWGTSAVETDSWDTS